MNTVYMTMPGFRHLLHVIILGAIRAVLVIAARYHGLLMVVKVTPVRGKKGLNIPAPYVNST